jgi:type IV pilus assembly protein PilW
VHAGIGANGSDVLSIQSGASGLGEVQLRVLPGSATATGLRVPSSVGLRAGDLLLITQGGANCLIEQLQAGFAGGALQQLSFDGTYAAATINGIDLASMGATDMAWVAPVGNVTGNLPGFALIGIGTNNTLVSYDLLQLDGSDTPQALEDGVYDLRARYGVDTNDDGVIDAWVAPTAAPWDAASLLDGSQASQRNLRRILAVRVGLILRNSAPEREAVSPSNLTLFSDLGAGVSVTRAISASEQVLRFRTLEFTVPLRNVLMAPQT